MQKVFLDFSFNYLTFNVFFSRSSLPKGFKINKLIIQLVLMAELDCLIVRQPYTSLIAFGKKRWEFRSYPTKKSGKIGIASSPYEPWQTVSPELNKVSHLFSRGVILATANLVTSFYVTASDLKRNITGPVQVKIHGKIINTCDKPIGEPIEDVNNAIQKKGWESFAWLLEDVKVLNKPRPFKKTSPKSTWVRVEM